MSSLHIALLGSRGIPARYGGFETLMEELSVRLAAAGNKVTVYCRSHYTPRELSTYRGVELVVLPTIRSKHLDTPVHTFLSALHAMSAAYDAALVVNSANAIFVPLLQVAGIPTALNVDGIEKRRSKWGRLGKMVYALSERLVTQLPQRLVTDARVIGHHYLERYGAASTVLSYGVEPRPVAPGPIHERLGLEPRKYFLYVSRFEPENNPHRVVEAYESVPGDLPLVMVGDAPYASSFISRLRATTDPRVLFPGAIYGEGYRELLSNALAYIQATEVGGTHPALVEAMGYGNCLVAHDSPEHREVAGDAALYFRIEDTRTLTDRLTVLLREPRRVADLGRAAADRARRLYRWDDVCAGYLDLFESLAGSLRR